MLLILVLLYPFINEIALYIYQGNQKLLKKTKSNLTAHLKDKSRLRELEAEESSGGAYADYFKPNISSG